MSWKLRGRRAAPHLLGLGKGLQGLHSKLLGVVLAQSGLSPSSLAQRLGHHSTWLLWALLLRLVNLDVVLKAEPAVGRRGALRSQLFMNFFLRLPTLRRLWFLTPVP